MNTPHLRSSLCFAASIVMLLGAAAPQSADKEIESKPAAVKPSDERNAADKDKPEAPDLGSGWGTLKGSFKFRGEIPVAKELNVVRPANCRKPVFDESLVVDPKSRGIANVLIYVRKTPRVHPSYEELPGKEVELKNIDCRLTPHVVGSTLKDKFVVVNADIAVHNVSADPGAGNRPYNNLLPKDGRFRPELKKPTQYPSCIVCAIHPWELAWHIVRPDPYFAVTAADGSFTIERLPAGVELEFQAWHERSRGEYDGLQAKPEWSKQGRFKLTIPKDGDVTTLDVEVDAKKFE